jgi:hypothetical protein
MKKHHIQRVLRKEKGVGTRASAYEYSNAVGNGEGIKRTEKKVYVFWMEQVKVVDLGVVDLGLFGSSMK